MRVLICHPENNLENNPVLLSIVNLSKKDNSLFFDYFSKCRFIVNNKNNKISRFKYFFYKFYFHSFVNYLNTTFLLGFIIDNFFIKSNRKYDLILGIDREGIIQAEALSNKLGIPFGLISFEIFSLSETSLKFKKNEIISSNKASFVIIQDEIRLNYFKNQNKVSNIKYFLLPVTSKLEEIYNENQIYFKSTFGIPEEKKILLHIGSVSEWTGIFELLRISDSIPEPYVLLVNTTENYFLNFKFNRKKIFFTNFKFLEYKDLYKIMNFIDFGLVFYTPTYKNKYVGENIHQDLIGYSSGKFTTFMKYNIPVITNCRGIIQDDLIKFKLGINVSNISELPEKLKSNFIFPKYSRINYFKEKLDFGLYEQGLLDLFRNTINHI